MRRRPVSWRPSSRARNRNRAPVAPAVLPSAIRLDHPRATIEDMDPEIERRFERLENLLGEVEKRFENRLGDVEERLSEQLRDMQTELLKAFLPWQEQVRI